MCGLYFFGEDDFGKVFSKRKEVVCSFYEYGENVRQSQVE